VSRVRGWKNAAAGAALILLSALATSGLPLPSEAHAGARYTVRTERVGRGLTLMRIKDARGPNRIRVLRLTRTSPLTLSLELANDEIPGHERTSSMAARNGAIAAINGDYTLLPSDPQAGRPVHTFAHNSELVTSPLVYGRNFALTPDDQTVYIGHPEFGAWLTQHETSEQWEVGAWNKVPAAKGELAIYTMAGGYNHRPPANACSARLMPLATPSLDPTGVSVSQPFTVTARACKSKPMARKGGTVVAAPWGSPQGSQIETGLVVGEGVTLTWTTGWPGIEDTIGGNPTVLENGAVTIGACPPSSYFCERNPRTAIGVDAQGRILLVTVDGRHKKSVGMTLEELAGLLRWLGATSALNLDGGGSTTMWVRGRIVNDYSDPTERPVGSAVLVVPTSTPTPTPSPQPTSLDVPLPEREPQAASARELACKLWRDPGSTGGLVDLLQRRGRLNFSAGPFRDALDVFRGRRGCSEVLGSRL
jgi:hypothetical protein